MHGALAESTWPTGAGPRRKAGLKTSPPYPHRAVLSTGVGRPRSRRLWDECHVSSPCPRNQISTGSVAKAQKVGLGL